MIAADEQPLQTSIANRRDKACVLHVLDHSFPVLSGYSVRSRNLISAQHRIGESIRVVTGPLHEMDDPASSEIVLDDVTYARTPVMGKIANSALRARWPVVRELEVVRLLRDRILELIKLHPARIIYAHSPVLCGLAALQAARKSGIPFVYEIRAFWEDAAADQKRASIGSVRSRLTRKLETYVAKHADAVGAIATPMLTDLQARGIPREKLFHVPNGVDATRFVPGEKDEAIKKQLGLGNHPVFSFFGSLYHYEGISWMIRAAAALRARGHQFDVLIIGRGEDQAAIQEAVRECNASQYVHTIDHVPHDQIQRYYSVTDIAVYPRRSIRLTELVTPLKPLEAMALKIPVLGSGVGGIRELIENENTGLLFQPEDVSDFCRQAERLILSPALRKSLGDHGREFVLREKNWDTLAQRYSSIYQFVLSGKPRR
jgi:PEP-CTERM/exosortase A-associated glycosyltransferase